MHTTRHAGRLLALLGASATLVFASGTGLAQAQEPSPLEETVMTARPAIAEILPGLEINLAFRGRLTRTGELPPVASREVVVEVGGQRVCTAITNPDGTWRCEGTLADVLGSLAGGYDAKFVGTDTLAPSSAHATALILLGIPLF